MSLSRKEAINTNKDVRGLVPGADGRGDSSSSYRKEERETRLP